MGIPRIRINEIGTQNIWNVQNVQVAETYSNNIPNDETKVEVKKEVKATGDANDLGTFSIGNVKD